MTNGPIPTPVSDGAAQTAEAVACVSPMRMVVPLTTARTLERQNHNLVQKLNKIAAGYKPCPYDTDNDGDCGRPACPYCGINEALKDL